MKTFIIKLQNRKFLTIGAERSKINLFLYVSSIVFWIGLFLFFIFNNSFRFIETSEIIDQTLLRTLTAAITGFGLAAAGAAMQGTTRNDLAGPTTLGLMPAATLGIIIFQVAGLTQTYLLYLLGFAIAMVIIGINFMTLKIKAYESSNFKSILVGFILGAGLSSLNTIIISSNPNVQEQVTAWIGSTSLNISWERFQYSTPFIFFGIILLMALAKKINIIEEDLSLATSLGIKIKQVYWIVAFAVILITVSSVVVIGSIVIIGIVMPHFVRLLFKTRNYLAVIPMSGVFASILIMAAIWLNARFPIGLNLIPVVVTTPLFLYLILRKVKKNG